MKILVSTLVAFAGLLAGTLDAQPLDTAFSYQGRLQDAGAPANGPYDFRFILYDAPVGGSQIGAIVTRDDVVVTGGLFTVSLDFGTSAFTGNKRWLDVAIRPGPSGGAYTALSERQELQSAPHSMFSQRTPWAGIAGKPAGFADDTDDDALGGLACGNGQVAKWNGTAWACAADVDTNSGGTVTNVATGAGLTGGPINTTGTVAVASGGITTALIANGAVTSPKIASGAVGLGQINTAEVQARVALTCPPGQYLRGINANGTVVCEPLFAPNGIATIDSGGAHASVALGADGLPVISYFIGAGTTSLRVAHCGNAACSAGNTIRIVDNTTSIIGQYTSIAIGTDGLPVVSYFDNSGLGLKVAHCGNADCSAGNTLNYVDNPANVQDTSIAIGTDGLPIISYYNAASGDLKVAHCGNVTCAPPSSAVTLDSATNAGQYSSIAIGADGLPVISYYDATAGDLMVIHCGNAACTAGNSAPSPVDTTGSVGLYTSIAIGPDGLPVISYFDATAFALKVAHCGNAACSAGNTRTTVDDPANIVGQYSSIVIGTDGLPVISYFDATANSLKVAHCGNASCTAGNSVTTVDDPPANSVGSFSSIAIGADGLPVIGHFDMSANSLKVAKCATRTCQ